MKEAYDNFSALTGYPQGTFILGNGAENVIKNVLLAVKPKILFSTVPGWGMIEVYSESVGFRNIPNRMYWNVGKKSLELEQVKLQNDSEWTYDYAGISNFCHYRYKDNYVPQNLITDLSYRSIFDKEFFPVEPPRGNHIIVGSFDKEFGVGFRLGFAIFDPKWNDLMQIQREEYINPSACKLLYLLKEEYISRKYEDFAQPLVNLLNSYGIKVLSSNNNFVVILGHYNFPFKVRRFNVNNKAFSRIGVPTTEQLYEIEFYLKNNKLERLDNESIQGME